MVFQVYWWFTLFQLQIYSLCPYIFIHLHTTNSFSAGTIAYKFLLSIWQTFYLRTGHTAPTPPHLPTPSSQCEESTARRLVSVEPRSLPFRPCSRSQSPQIPCPNGPKPISRVWLVSVLVYSPRQGMRGDQRLVSIGQVDMQGWVCTWLGGCSWRWVKKSWE